uniref:Putative terminase n=1 Tax=viral metagenome TaxID=1070528 RepID=A0A6H1ZEC9_9ZZZZ
MRAKKDSLIGSMPTAQGKTAEERMQAFEEAHRCFFWKPYPWQERLLEVMRTKSTVAAISSNKIGKSAACVCILLSWLFGCEPWNPRKKEDEDAFELHGQYYRTSSLGIPPPVNIILTGEDWKSHIGRVLIPELKKWAPVGWYNTKKNEQGAEYYWEWMNKSTLSIMSYSQDDDLFESFRAQGVIMDEPPPKSKYSAMSRGLLLDRGKTLLNLTPLKEAWILDEIVLSGRRDIGIVDNLKITDNPDLFNSDLRLLGEMGLERLQKQEFFRLLLYEDWDKKLPVSDKGHAAERYLEKVVSADKIERLTELKILKFIKDIDPSDVPPRVFGQFKSLVGRVLKEFDMNIHVIKPFEVPTDWPVTVMIDFHLSVPQAITYFAVNKQDIHYAIAEVWKNLSAEEIADDIIRMKKSKAWNIKRVFIDPLSKGDTSYMRNQLGTNIRDTYTIIDEKLSHHGITLSVASKDKESGIKNVQTMLKGVNGLPTFYVFDNMERWLFEVLRWVFDDDGKPAKDGFDHMMENTYRYTLTGTTYEYDQIKPLPKSNIINSPSSWMAL